MGRCDETIGPVDGDVALSANAPMSASWIDGRAASADDLRALALVNHGHFTTMQVRAGAVQGLDLHLQRLQTATRELFDTGLDDGRIRGSMHAALAAADLFDCTLRATVFARDATVQRPQGGATPALLVTTAPARQADGGSSLRLQTRRYQRAWPHLKHVGTFAAFRHRALAQGEGFDDALFVDADGLISEGSTWNIGFWDGEGVVWPQAAALRGVTERLLQLGLEMQGVPQARRAVATAELSGLRGAFTCNTGGLHAVAGINAIGYPDWPDFMRRLGAALASQPWQPLQDRSFAL